MLALVLALASCDMLPEEVKNALGIEHTHNFLLDSATAATCEETGEEIYKCSCGEEKITVLEALGHHIKLIAHTDATCEEEGSDCYACSRCGGEESTYISNPIGHFYVATSSEPSRFAFCSREGCSSAQTAFGSSGKYTDVLTFNFTKEHEAEIDAKYQELLSLLTLAVSYDPENPEHKYASEGAVADEYAAVDALHTELYNLILYAVAQRQIAEIDYYCDMKNTELEETYSYMMNYYTDVIAKFYSLSQPFYDCCYREFFYYGMTEEEIAAYLFDSNALADPEYAALKSRNDAIELEYFAISNPQTSSKVNQLYYEYVQNNNRMAEIMGYDNYLDYAYENVYGRDYSYEDVALITEYVGTYLSESFKNYYAKYISALTEPLTVADYEYYVSQVEGSFFGNYKSNLTVNNYVDKMNFTSNPDKQISFSDELNNLCVDGNLYYGTYSGAFVTYLDAFETPVAYFSPTYDTPFTIVHEFGHYMNEIYNRSEYSQSYDLLEMHSQGNEMLYLAYIEGNISYRAFKHVENEQIFNTLATVMASLAVDAFERAIYTDSYSGYYSDVIMADGTITYDEYDQLYRSINVDLGVSGYLSDTYWKYGMTIQSPCYYVSYAVSALSVLQLYETARTTGFQAAADSYLKLFTYTDVNPDFTDKEVLEYAGMYSATDEQLYINLESFFNGN